MKQYVRPNLILPISLHDAVVGNVTIERGSSGIADAVITLFFPDGFFVIGDDGADRSGAAKVTFSGVDMDFSEVAYIAGKKRIVYPFEKLGKDARMHNLELIDEAYGYNKSFFSLLLLSEAHMDKIEVSIYHFNSAIYEWE